MTTLKSTYDSRPDTLLHSQRVGELLVAVVKQLLDRSTCHDASKLEPPEVDVFDEFTPKLKASTYGSAEYKGYLAAMGEGLAHHYAHNRHHPDAFTDGVNGMTLVDVVEMLADWKAATERHTNGDLRTSLDLQRERFGLSDQLWRILWNTAVEFRWMSVPCGAKGRAPNGDHLECNVPLDRPDGHDGPHADGRLDSVEWTGSGSACPTNSSGFC